MANQVKPITYFKMIWQGCGYLEGYGHHPGTPVLLTIIVIGLLVGLQDGLIRAILGAIIMLVIYTPLYLIGAYGRAKDFYSDKTKRKK